MLMEASIKSSLLEKASGWGTVCVAGVTMAKMLATGKEIVWQNVSFYQAARLQLDTTLEFVTPRNSSASL